MQLQMKRLSLSLWAMLFSCWMVLAGAYLPEDIANPHAYSLSNYVANPDNILSQTTVDKLNQLSLSIDHCAEVELVVVAIDDMAYTTDVADFSQTLFNAWGIGKKGKNTGVLILLVRNSRDVRIHTGGGMEGVLPDGRCSDIVQNQMIPLLREEQWDAGIMAGAEAIAMEVTTDEALQELLLEPMPEHTPWGLYLSYYLSISLVIFILLLLTAYRELNGSTNLPRNIRYHKASTKSYLFKVGAIFFPLPNILLLVWYKKQVLNIRTTLMFCPECKQKMKRLSEKEEDAYLNRAEQTEETIKSIDYDVWLCPSCYNHIVLPYELSTTRYTRCPYCHAKTYGLVSDVVVSQPTTLSQGRGEKTYACRHCGKTVVKAYAIPAVPVVVAGSGRGSGGGFSGGSFGGGISFGGGAGGKF